ncbi:hypothetical protein [Paenibacillus campi]|uniref:hypothetical protein n=1 Tax=Paenibacillus campi TaxID=3106031 RepID=UPI002AFDF14E|nr:hypothetical protein [Paenibacillus sp. SGZ-1014]
MTNLHWIFSQMQQDVEHTLHETEPMKHPLIALIRYSLHEQQEALGRLLPLLSANHTPPSSAPDSVAMTEHSLSLNKIKPYIILLYQNQEVSEPTVRAWVRAVHWIPSFETEASAHIQNRFNDMHQRLEAAGALLVQSFGQTALKFVIPSAYTETEVKA